MEYNDYKYVLRRQHAGKTHVKTFVYKNKVVITFYSGLSEDVLKLKRRMLKVGNNIVVKDSCPNRS